MWLLCCVWLRCRDTPAHHHYCRSSRIPIGMLLVVLVVPAGPLAPLLDLFGLAGAFGRLFSSLSCLRPFGGRRGLCLWGPSHDLLYTAGGHLSLRQMLLSKSNLASPHLSAQTPSCGLIVGSEVVQLLGALSCPQDEKLEKLLDV